jgi:hypothetical protein
MCNHDNKDLIGVENGIKCRACGKVFASFAEIEKDRAAEAPKDAPQTPEIEPIVEEPKEKVSQVKEPLKKASDDKSAKKAPTKKTPSKKGAK